MAPGGAIVAEPIIIPEGAVRDMVAIRRLPASLPAEPVSAYAPTPVDIPAVSAKVTQGLMRTRETWHWTDGPQPSSAAVQDFDYLRHTARVSSSAKDLEWLTARARMLRYLVANLCQSRLAEMKSKAETA